MAEMGEGKCFEKIPRLAKTGDCDFVSSENGK